MYVFLIGAVTGLAYLQSSSFRGETGFSEEERIGIHLAQGDGFLSAFAEGRAAPPTSWCPPVYPALVGGLYRAFGVRSDAAVILILAFNFFCRAAAAVAVFRLGLLLFGRASGVAGAALFLIHPMFLRMPAFCWDNVLALGLFLWLLVAAVHIRRGGPTAARLAALGGGLGLLALTNASYVLTFPALVLTAAGPRPWRRPGLVLAAGGLFGLVLLPWTARNHARFGKVFFVRANAYAELWLGNQPCSTGWMTLQTLDAHPSRDRTNADLVLGLGEIRYFDLCRRRFYEELHAAPTEFRLRCRNRLAYAFISDPGRKIEYPFMPNYRWTGIILDRLLVNGVLAVLGVAGAYAAFRLRYRTYELGLVALLSVAPYLAAQLHDRYVMPLRAILTIFAGFVLAAAYHRVRNASWPAPVLRN